MSNELRQVRAELGKVRRSHSQLPRPRRALLSLVRVVWQCKATATKAELGKLEHINIVLILGMYVLWAVAGQ